MESFTIKNEKTMTLTTTIIIDEKGDHASGYPIERYHSEPIRYDFLYQPIADEISIEFKTYKVMYSSDVHEPKFGKLSRIIRVEPKY